jgi:formate hydrogenlyase subunit 3/multisubunit Na+/H+ antiporter MnhD subunit
VTIASGSEASNFTLGITTPQQTAQLHQPVKLLPFSLATLLLLPFAGRLRRRARKLSGICAMLLLLIGTAAGMTMLSGCGSANGFLSQPQQSYTVTVTATSGTLTHSTTVTLTVE